MSNTADRKSQGTGQSKHGTVEESAALINRELGTIMPVIAAVMGQEADADGCSFYIYDDEAWRTVATFRHGEAKIRRTSMTDVDSIDPSEIPVEAEILRSPRSIRRSCDADFERFPIINDAIRHLADNYADVAVPLVQHGQVYGVVYLWRYGESSPFTDSEVASIESLAHVAAMAVEFARQYKDERLQRVRLNALLNVASLAASHTTVEEVMPAITRIVRNVSEADICNIYVFEDNGETVADAFSSGLNERERWVFDESDRYSVSSVPAEDRARRTLEPVIVRDPENDLAPGSELIEYCREGNLSEILIAPIVYQGAMIGVAYLWYRDPDRRFSAEVVSTIQAIASQAGGVVSQARLHDAHQRQIVETEALRRIGESVLNSDRLDDVLDQIAGVLADAIPYDYAFVGQIEDGGNTAVVKRAWGKFPMEVLGYRIDLDSSLTGVAVRSGRIVNSPDALSDPRMHRYQPQRLQIRSVLISPLVTENGTIGVLYIGRGDAEGYSRRQEQLMTLLSQHAAAAIERTQARASQARDAQRQTFLASVTNSLVSASEPTDVLQEICEMGSAILVDGMVIALSSWEHGSLRWMAGAHRDPMLDSVLNPTLLENGIVLDPDRVETMLASDTPSLMALDSGVPSDGRELHPTVMDLLSRLGVRQMLTVPMRQRGRAPGLIVLLASDPEQPIDDDLVHMAQLAANRIGDALERRQMTHNRESLLRLSEAINAHTELEELLQLFASELNLILPYDEMYLGRLDAIERTLRPLISVNPLGLQRSEVELDIDQVAGHDVIDARRALLDNNAHARSPASNLSDGANGSDARRGKSAMAAPLIVENDVIGVLYISRTGTNRFSDSDYETFLLFSGLAASAIYRTELLQDNQLLYRASVEVLAAVVDAKDPTTLEHSRNVARYARIIAESLNLGAVQMEQIELAGLLHDIGKLSIPDHVLSKPGPLSEQERALINAHPVRGANILNQHPSLLDLVPLVLHHHERVDGTGYPDGLAGDDIPLGASIIAVADAFDTMTSQRAYQRRKSVTEALEELQCGAGSQFDADLVSRFIVAVREDPDNLRARRTPEDGRVPAANLLRH